MTHIGWNRYQWAGDQGTSRTVIDVEPATARWNLSQWVGEGQGQVSRPTAIQATGDSGRPSGFSGFGVSDSGGQQWAPSASSVAVQEDAAQDEEAVA